MITDDQRATIAFLSDARTHGTIGKVEVIETHISRIFLCGSRAWKTKRAVKLPYVDFSKPRLRLAACRREVELNSLTAPGVYIAAHRITRGADGALSLDGKGELVDGVVEMHRFDQDCLLDRMAANGKLTPRLMGETAIKIEHFHRLAPVSRSESGASNMAAVLDINEAGFAESKVFNPLELRHFHGAMRNALARHSELLDRRSAAGRVRRCHGDLHLRNICLINGAPQLFDCIEFNDRIATVDVLYDLAFLLMDLWHRGLAELANLTMNRYLDQAGDEDGFPLLPFFMAVRAAVRAHVLGTQVAEGEQDGRVVEEARSYFRLAKALLMDVAPRLVAIGGLSGSGKTTVAEALAARVGAPPGARIVESDRIRKAMHGVPPETRLPQRAYLPEVSEKVYRQMAWSAGLILSEAGCVVADAVFDRAEHRAAIAKVAADNAAPFVGFWLTAGADVLRRRVAARRGGPSDATTDVLSRQLDRKITGMEWQSIDSARSPAEIVGDIVDVLAQQNPAPWSH
jgi:aminoglycoside phosphotransferase family enzyme/predicted kinase